jgi:putative spermidine/putrescine transport system permease protein
MTLSPLARVMLRVALGVVLAFMYIPLLFVLLNSFNASRVGSWPPDELTLTWWSTAFENTGARDALIESLVVATWATAIALVLGSMIAFAVARYQWFGRDSISLLVVLPIALPGIVTGVALQNAFVQVLPDLFAQINLDIEIGLGLFTVIIAHTTFCLVIVFNNVVARLRRASTSMEEASMDLGASTWQTFRLVTFPQVRSALLAGGLLAFGLSFDEIIVTQLAAGAGVQTLPIWIFNNLSRPNVAPVVNVVAALVILISIIPVYFAQRLSDDPAHSRM